MAEHKINCPGCDQHLSVPEELAGQQIDCPSCSKPMTVPAGTVIGLLQEGQSICWPASSSGTERC